jgi:type IV pilus assembly protein PilV
MQMKARGFSLIEVMVALIIISVGLLGIAKMQALALASTGTARLRSLAAIEAASLASAMHTDRTYWAFLNTAGSTVQVTGTTVMDATLGASVSCTGSGGSRPSPACTPPKMAAEDLQKWAQATSAVLPNAQALIKCKGDPITCTIDITWAEHIVNANTSESGASSSLTTYTLAVEP